MLHIEPNLFEIKQLILLKSNWFFCYLSMHHQQMSNLYKALNSFTKAFLKQIKTHNEMKL
jgi:hypothetical protein